jgi:hypothetical protein
MPVPTSKVDAETPVSLHGDMDEKPIPAPNAMRRSVRAAAATAPAATAGHETLDSACRSTTAALAVVAGYVVASIEKTPGKEGHDDPLKFSFFNSAICGKFHPFAT